MRWIKSPEHFHLGAMWSPYCFAQLNHAVGLNDVCDALSYNAARLFTIRGFSSLLWESV